MCAIVWNYVYTCSKLAHITANSLIEHFRNFRGLILFLKSNLDWQSNISEIYEYQKVGFLWLQLLYEVPI